MFFAIQKLRFLIKGILSEGFDDSDEESEKRWVPATKNSPGRYEIVDKPDPREVDKVPPSQRMSHVQRFEKDTEAWIEHLAEMPEFSSLKAFKETKIDDDDFEFDFMELNALARVLWRDMVGEANAHPPYDFFKNVKKDLIDFGLKFKPRKIIKLPRSGHSTHGTHPFAGQGGGGSGFGFDGTPGGRGPGNVGGKRSWDPDGKDLPMGAGKYRRNESLSLRKIIFESVCEKCGYDNEYVDEHPYICRQCKVRDEKWGESAETDEAIPATVRYKSCPDCGGAIEQGHEHTCDLDEIINDECPECGNDIGVGYPHTKGCPLSDDDYR